MIKQRQLASRVGLAVVMTVLVGASAFADSRPQKETRGRGNGRAVGHHGSKAERPAVSRGDRSSNDSRKREEVVDRRSERRESNRTEARTDARIEVRGERVTRSNDQDRSTRTNDRDRPTRTNDRTVNRDSARSRDTTAARGTERRDRDRSGSDSRNRGSYDRRDDNHSGRETNPQGDWRSGRSGSRHTSPSYGGSNRHYRRPHYSHGRVSRTLRYGNGYRVWLYGTPYPFFIPLSYYRHDRFRVGLSINLGGYYNPGGYYDYYDGRSSGAIRGLVESVDYDRDSFVIRNDVTGSFVTVLARDRRLDVRAGDYVEITGEWTRGGAFQAWDVDLMDDDYNR